MDWTNPFYSRMPEPIGEINMGEYGIPVIPIPEKLFSPGLHGKKIKAYALACFTIPPNGKRIPADYMIDMAVAEGLLKPGDTLVEYTSGGMGAAMAFRAKKQAIIFHAVVSDSMPEGKLLPQTRLGAVVIRESDAMRLLGLKRSPGALELTRLYAEKIGGLFLNQYHHRWNPESWEKLVAPQLWELFGGELTAAFFGLGSTGTLRGLGGYLKERGATVVATHPYLTQGISGLRDPARLREVAEWEHIPDYREPIDFRTAKAFSSELFSVAGIPAGESSGAVSGMCDHYYLDRLVRGELAETNLAIMPMMDTFVPYLDIG